MLMSVRCAVTAVLTVRSSSLWVFCRILHSFVKRCPFVGGDDESGYQWAQGAQRTEREWEGGTECRDLSEFLRILLPPSSG